MHYEHAIDIIKNHNVDLILEKPPALKINSLKHIYKIKKIKYFSSFSE